MANDQEVRVRIAPSPTGNLHVGTARTALFNYLFAKRHQGKFILRIEDTDQERSQTGYTQNIYDSLRALGLAWDEGPDVGGPFGPYQQTERLEIYREWANKLLTSGHAYHCYHTPEELENERSQAQAENRVYVDACREAEARETLSKDTARKPSLKFRIPGNRGTVTFPDHVRGDVSFDTALIPDFVVLKSDGMPTYNFAVVVDDITMKITHVIRGEDHVSNTPRQLLIYEALAEKPPEFAHVSMILAPDRSKLSKRHGATAVSEFIQRGYLPEAFCNFLALLGWSPPDGEEIGSLNHFAAEFGLDRITQSPAIFDTEKLNFINGKYIRMMPLDELLKRVKPYLEMFNLDQYSEAQLMEILDAVRERVTLLSEFPEHINYFFGQGVILDAQMVGEVLTGPEQEQVLRRFRNEFLPSADFDDSEALHGQIKAFTEAMKPIKTKIVMWTIRAAVTGRTSGADLSRVLQILGKQTVDYRLETAINLTTGSPA